MDFKKRRNYSPTIVIPAQAEIYYLRPLHNYMEKEKIEKICQIDVENAGNSWLLTNFPTKSW